MRLKALETDWRPSQLRRRFWEHELGLPCSLRIVTDREDTSRLRKKNMRENGGLETPTAAWVSE